MGTVTHLHPKRARRRPQRDRALDARLVVGTVVEHPDGGMWGPPCLARLVSKDADGNGIHDWLVLSCGEEPEVVGTIASFPTLMGAEIVRYDAPEQRVAAGEVRRD